MIFFVFRCFIGGVLWLFLGITSNGLAVEMKGQLYDEIRGENRS